jgi:hypothetical protein
MRVLEHHLEVLVDLCEGASADRGQRQVSQQDLAARRVDEPRDTPCHCGLARPALTDQCKGLPCVELELDVIHCGQHLRRTGVRDAKFLA